LFVLPIPLHLDIPEDGGEIIVETFQKIKAYL